MNTYVSGWNPGDAKVEHPTCSDYSDRRFRPGPPRPLRRISTAVRYGPELAAWCFVEVGMPDRGRSIKLFRAGRYYVLSVPAYRAYDALGRPPRSAAMWGRGGVARAVGVVTLAEQMIQHGGATAHGSRFVEVDGG